MDGLSSLPFAHVMAFIRCLLHMWMALISCLLQGWPLFAVFRTSGWPLFSVFRTWTQKIEREALGAGLRTCHEGAKVGWGIVRRHDDT